jgi:hypothetical protein
MSHTIINAGYRSTNYWLLSTPSARQLIDLGWPGMFDTLAVQPKRMGVPLVEVTHGLATHYHLDHAGAAQDLKQAGMRLIVLDVQANAIEPMRAHIKPTDRYTPITLGDNLALTCATSRAFLRTLGMAPCARCARRRRRAGGQVSGSTNLPACSSWSSQLSATIATASRESFGRQGRTRCAVGSSPMSSIRCGRGSTPSVR